MNTDLTTAFWPPAVKRALLGALALIALLAACALSMIAGPARAHAASPVKAALTVIDATDGSVVFNDAVQGLTDENTVADLLGTAGFTQADSWAKPSDYMVSNGAPYFLGKGFDAQTGNYWQTLFNGSSNNWANAMLEIEDPETKAKSAPKLQDGHYQYIYGNGSQELAHTVGDTYEVAFSYGLHEYADPFMAVNNTFAPQLLANLQARFSLGGANAAIDNMAYIAAPALALAGKGSALDVEAITANLDAERSAGTLTAGRLAKYIIALTAAGKDCTAVRCAGGIANLVAEMEGLMTKNESAYDAVLILPAYHYGSYSMANSPLGKDELVGIILAAQAESGLFGGEYASSQLTAQAMLALEPFVEGDPKLQGAVDKALKALFALQHQDGGLRYDATQDFSDVNTAGEASAALAARGLDAGGKTSPFCANDQGLTPITFLCGAADSSQDGYATLATSLGYNETMMAAYALAGLTTYNALVEEGKDGYLYSPVSVTPDAPADATWKRLRGSTALDTMSAIVDEGAFAQGGTVVLTTAGGYWDALTAAGVAGLAQAPVLLTDGTTLSAQTKAQLERLKPSKIIVCGGTGSVSAGVAEAAAQAASGESTTVRMAGGNASGTANDIFAKAAAETGGAWSATQTAFVCTSETYHDALAAAPLSYRLHMPIFLTDGVNIISDATLKAMGAGNIKKAVIVGGKGSIDEGIEDALAAHGITVEQRLGGRTSIETSELVAAYGIAHGMSADKMGVASSGGHWDALSGSALCGKNNAVMVLADAPTAHSITGFVLQHANAIWNGYVFGGTGSVSEETEQALVNATKTAVG